jgi:hypothetical protein
VALRRLSELQVRVLEALADLQPPWTLSGGGALAGFHTGHRGTRDLDLFFQGRRALEGSADQVRARLENAGLRVTALQTAPAFARFDVQDGSTSVVVDLVADPVPLAEAPRLHRVGEVEILVDTPHQLLVNKLCALLSRSELRDLLDVQVLLAEGGLLERALADAPGQDAGFSPLTLAWTLRALPVDRLASALGWPQETTASLTQFRDGLVRTLVERSAPPPDG